MAVKTLLTQTQSDKDNAVIIAPIPPRKNNNSTITIISVNDIYALTIHTSNSDTSNNSIISDINNNFSSDDTTDLSSANNNTQGNGIASTNSKISDNCNNCISNIMSTAMETVRKKNKKKHNNSCNIRERERGIIQ